MQNRLEKITIVDYIWSREGNGLTSNDDDGGVIRDGEKTTSPVPRLFDP